MIAAGFTVEQIEASIGTALKENNQAAAVSLLKVLAVRAPDRAQAIMNAILLANEVLS